MQQNIKNPELKKPTPATYSKNGGSEALKSFFLDALKDIYWAEQELTKAIPKLMEAATTKELKKAFQEHLEQTSNHVTRLEEVFRILGVGAEAKTCHAMEGLVKESESIIEETTEGTMTRDAALILAAQKVEHYEIATYGALIEYAKLMGHNDIHGLLQATFDDERIADQGLTLIAQNKINWEADLEDNSSESRH